MYQMKISNSKENNKICMKAKKFKFYTPKTIKE